MRRFALFTLILLLSLPFVFVVSAQQELPPVNPAEVTGDIIVSGTPILNEVTNSIGLLFRLEGYGGTLAIDSNGTSEALNGMCAGTVDIALADRQMSAAELDACSSNGRPPLAFRVSTIAVMPVLARQNQFAVSMTTEELQQVLSTALNWSDVRPDWPDDAITRYGPATTSSSFTLLSELLYGGDTTPLTTAVGAQYFDDRNLVINNTTVSTTAIGFVDANFGLLSTSLVKGIVLDGVEPTFNNFSDNTYPLSRPLFLYTTNTAFTEKPQVASFINYYLTNLESESANAGLFPPPANALEVATNRWLTANGTTQVQQPTAVPTIVAQPTEIPVIEAEATTEPEVTEAETVEAPVEDELFTPEIQQLLVNARLDLELVADEWLGAERSPGWSGSFDLTDPRLPLLLRLDTELLAAQVYGVEERPDAWFGAINSTQLAIARDIRHDVELLANDVFENGERPVSWAGADPLLSCDRSTQALVTLLFESGLYENTVDEQAEDYCQQVTVNVSRFVEVNLIGVGLQVGSDGVTVPDAVTIETNIAVGFFNTSASRRAGVIPESTGVTPVARSYAGFTNMTLVQGENFLLFVEWQNTSLTLEEWLLLPNEAELEYETTCGELWCSAQG